MSETLLERLKARLDENELSDDKLQEIIDDVTQEVLSDTNQSELNLQLSSAVVSLSVITVNRIGTEGLASEGYSGVSTSYLDDVPPRVASILNANRRLGVWEDEDESIT
ncbi:phage head-tail connector protein [Lactococcus raffinolactis]|uniref:phage head-tail connector protein n=1 Tax=Pseudolactococcus raffinolactis TaxID=1366 RepID=UPI0028923B55|nr:phage head-tail connector protein [Lactococcus raffinolactis]MDT2766540.1 phage head-tail connector protein [Lactococcus raffinolactis]MDT2789700.1 phage head-tail connector protein [Lactococcus raffinolactis]